MKKKTRFWISPLIIIMGLLFLAGFCQKDDDDDTPGEITDKDGNVYTSVIIGTQEWMAENLKTTKYNDGTDIPLVTDDHEWIELTTGAYCWYNNDAATYKTPYGALYNWYAVNTGKLCPTGWRVPTNAEWSQLTDFLGGDDIAGGKLKESGTTHWNSPNTGATNETGFTALPSGYREYHGTYNYVGYNGYWWSSQEGSTTHAYGRGMYYDISDIYICYFPKLYGWSVRCLRDL
jgi:uncharacterized protein (TIGR02145 family)